MKSEKYVRELRDKWKEVYRFVDTRGELYLMAGAIIDILNDVLGEKSK